MKIKIIGSVLLLSIVTSCSNTNNYELSDELKEKAQAVKQKANSTSEKETTSTITQETSPLWVTDQIFLAATTANALLLGQLCDPLNEPEGKAKMLCETPFASQNEQEKFMAYFKLGKVEGEPIITGDKAVVNILVGYDGTAPETLKMIKREGKWYLSSF